MERLEAGEAPGQGIQNQFVEAQQIDFGCSGPWEAGEAPGRESKMNLLRLNKLILVVQGRGKLEAGEAPGRESKINLLRLNKLILVVPGDLEGCYYCCYHHHTNCDCCRHDRGFRV